MLFSQSPSGLASLTQSPKALLKADFVKPSKKYMVASFAGKSWLAEYLVNASTASVMAPSTNANPKFFSKPLMPPSA